MKQTAQVKIVVVMICLGIILAGGVFLAISAIQNRPDGTEALPAPGEKVIVEGQEVTLVRNPELTVRLVSPTELLAEQAQPEAAENEPPADQPVPMDTPVPEPPPPPEPTATAVIEKIILIDYTVQQSDSLYSVANRIDTSISLMALYNIAQDNLVPNTVIRLPVGNPNYCPGRRPYAVGEGDTAFSISHRFNISTEELRTINSLNEDFTVKVADILCVP